MLNKIPALIKSTQFETRNGYITFSNVGYHPVREIEKGETVYLYPKNSRQKTIPYFAEIYADVIFTPKIAAKLPSGEVQYMNNAKPETKQKFELGKVPVMLGSELCHLYGLSEEQRMEKGECFNDPLGYFIVKSERVILSQVGLRLSTFLIYKLKESKDASKESAVVGKITCPTEQGTCVVELYIQSKIKSVRVMLQHIKKQNNPSGRGYPLFLIYKILGVDIEDAIDQIKKFILWTE
jgi:DNA-directed RNA polymerase beta subunit